MYQEMRADFVSQGLGLSRDPLADPELAPYLVRGVVENCEVDSFSIFTCFTMAILEPPIENYWLPPDDREMELLRKQKPVHTECFKNEPTKNHYISKSNRSWKMIHKPFENE